MDEEKQGVGNPFDAPVPGQSLTDTPGNYPWEHPPQFTDPEEATEFIWQTLHTEEFMEQVIGMLDAGVPIEAIARVIVFGGFVEGKFTPDVGLLIKPPLAIVMAGMAEEEGIPYRMFENKNAGEENTMDDKTFLRMIKTNNPRMFEFIRENINESIREGERPPEENFLNAQLNTEEDE